MITKEIILFKGEEYELNITAILNSIIAFVMDILGKEVPEINDVIGE
jgi:hypothetical protein